MVGATNHKSYGLGIQYFNEVSKLIVYILDDIIVFFCLWFYYTVYRDSLMQPQNTKVVYVNAPPPVADTYYILINTYTIKLLLLIMSYSRSFI